MKISTVARTALADALRVLFDTGSNLYIRTGAAPTNTTDADSGTLLSTVPMNATPFPAAVAGVLTANAFTTDSNVAATGTAAHFRIKDSGGVVVAQGSVGTTATDLIVNTTSFVAAGSFQVTSFTITVPAGS